MKFDNCKLLYFTFQVKGLVIFNLLPSHIMTFDHLKVLKVFLVLSSVVSNKRKLQHFDELVNFNEQ